MEADILQEYLGFYLTAVNKTTLIWWSQGWSEQLPLHFIFDAACVS